MNQNLGTDLTVIPFFVAHDAGAFDFVPRVRTRRGALPASTLAPDAQDAVDLSTLTGRENLAQALILRMLTPIGSLRALGHANYGSRLHELIGQRKTDSLRNLCRAYVLEVVAQEPRVEDTAVDLQFDPLAETYDSFVFTLTVQPRTNAEALTLALEVGI